MNGRQVIMWVQRHWWLGALPPVRSRAHELQQVQQELAATDRRVAEVLRASTAAERATTIIAAQARVVDAMKAERDARH